jgi:hypothetical protein
MQRREQQQRQQAADEHKERPNERR